MMAPEFIRRGWRQLRSSERSSPPEDTTWVPIEPYHTYEVPRESWREVIRATRPRWWLHAALLILTSVSCYAVAGTWYAVGTTSILLAHELGHYVMALRWGVRATVPYFLPFPSVPGFVVSPIGTLGAVIVMRSRMPNRHALLDIGAAGPLAGFLVTLVVLTTGLSRSSISMTPFAVLPPGYATYIFGDSLLFVGLTRLIIGSMPDGAHVIWDPLVRAGWVGMFVTAVNLLPLGQLDGGHISYALSQRRYRTVSIVTTGLLILMVYVSFVWTVFALMAVTIGRKHPAPIDNSTPLDGRRRMIGYICVVVFVLCFMPNPLDVVGW
jgi:membrane-associated protease RseP (regulator of RpoE activity)